MELLRQTRSLLFHGGPAKCAALPGPAGGGQTGHEETGKLDVGKELRKGK